MMKISAFIIAAFTVLALGEVGVSANVVRKRREVYQYEHCPNGSVRHDNSCYMFSHLLANWPEAYVYCEAFASHLVYIEDEREQTFLRDQVKAHYGSQTDRSHYYWIGGTDAMSEGDFYWATVMRPVLYTNWSAGQPSDNGHGQDCMAMFGSTGLWDDGTCDQTHNFICEIELDEEPVVVG